MKPKLEQTAQFIQVFSHSAREPPGLARPSKDRAMAKAAGGRTPPPLIIPKHRTQEFRVLEVLWSQGSLSIQQIREGLPEAHRPSYETVRSIVYRLQERKSIRRVRKVSKSQIFEAIVRREDAHAHLIDDFASLFADDIRPVIDRLVSTGRLTLDDLREAERLLGMDKKRA
jgi:BlaI family penicillinase repressor